MYSSSLASRKGDAMQGALAEAAGNGSSNVSHGITGIFPKKDRPIQIVQ
jgi:hypothetical protein